MTASTWDPFSGDSVFLSLCLPGTCFGLWLPFKWPTSTTVGCGMWSWIRWPICQIAARWSRASRFLATLFPFCFPICLDMEKWKRQKYSNQTSECQRTLLKTKMTFWIPATCWNSGRRWWWQPSMVQEMGWVKGWKWDIKCQMLVSQRACSAE